MKSTKKKLREELALLLRGPRQTKLRDDLGCYRKSRFNTELDARRFLRKKKITMRVYPCFECGGYHITSQLNRDN